MISLEHTITEEFVPDIAVINIAVVSEDEIINNAINDNNEKMNSIIEQLDKMDEVDYTTLNYRTQAITKDYFNDKKPTNYYKIFNQLEVKTTKIEQIPIIIKKALDNGANNINSLNYKLEDREEYKNIVIQKGLKEIRNKAENVAEGLEKNIKNTQTVRIEKNLNPPMTYREKYQVSKFNLGGMGNEKQDLTLTPEPVEIKVTIMADYLAQ